MNKENKLAHIAGIIDARVCFSVNHKITHGVSRGYYTSIKFASINHSLIEYFAKTVGYGHVHHHKYAHCKHPIYTWEIFAVEQEKFLATYMPLLQVKKEQAAVIKQFRTTKAIEDDKERLKVRKALFLECRKLKRV